MFSSRSFIVSGLIFRSLIHFEFIFVYGVRKCSSFILLQVVDPHWPFLLTEGNTSFKHFSCEYFKYFEIFRHEVNLFLLYSQADVARDLLGGTGINF